MAFRNDIAALRHRVEACESELAELRAAVRACDAELAQRLDQDRADAESRYEILRATQDPDIRSLRVWHSKMPVIAGGFGAFGLGWAIFGNWRAGLFFALLGALALQLVSRRTIVNRRSKTFDVRLPWGPRAQLATKPIAPERITVHRNVKRHKGTTEITFAVEIDGNVLANGLPTEAKAHEIAAELRDFLSS